MRFENAFIAACKRRTVGRWRRWAIALLAVFFAGCGQPDSPAPTTGSGRALTADPDDSAESIIDGLLKASTLDNCKDAVQRLNARLEQAPGAAIPALNAEQRAPLNDPAGFALNAEQIAEVANPTFTALDAHYLNTCLLLREAAKGLEADGKAATGPRAVERDLA